MRAMQRSLVATLSLLAVAAGLVGGIAVASNSQKTYTACLGTSGQIMHVAIGTTPAKPGCSPTETQVSWNESGPQGPAGPAGPAGPPGTIGFYVVEDEVLPPDLPENPWVVPSNSYEAIEIPPGDFVVSCDSGDAAVSGDFYRRSMYESGSGAAFPFDLQVQWDETLFQAAGVVTSGDGVPTGYSNLTTVWASTQWSLWEASPQYSAIANRSWLQATITCADMTP